MSAQGRSQGLCQSAQQEGTPTSQRSAEPAPAAAATTPEQAARLAAAARAAVHDLSARMHPSWACRLAPASPAAEEPAADLNSLNALPVAVRDAVILDRLGLRWPQLSAASEPVQRLWLLSAAELKRVCSARCLFDHGLALRRCIDAEWRRHARQAVGDATLAALVAHATHESPRALALKPADDLPQQGWWLLRAAQPFTDLRARRLVDLVFPAQSAPPEAATSTDLHKRFVSRLGVFFPELAWLFG